MLLMVKVKKTHKDAVIPIKAYDGDAGFDLHAVDNVIISPGQTAVINTGLAFEIPHGYEVQIRPRSGISKRTKFRVVLGTIDSEFRGSVQVIADNIAHSYHDESTRFVESLNGQQIREADFYPTGSYAVLKGDKIAQAVIQKIPTVELCEVDELSATNRGENGLGSTGV